MAITLVGAEKVTEAESGSVLDPSCPKPAGTAEGDFVLLVASANNDANTLELPAGFTEAYNGTVPNSAVGATHLAVGWKIAGASEASAYTVTLGGLDGYALSCSTFTGVDSESPVAVSFTFATESSSTVIPDVPSVNVPAAGDMMITLASVARGAGYSEMDFDDYYAPPSGVTEFIDVNYGAGTNYSGHALGYEEATAAGASGARTWTHLDNDDGGLAGALVLSRDTGAEALLTGSAEIEAFAGGVLGDPEPINHVESVTGVGNGTGTISLTYPASMAPGHLAIAAISADDGSKPVSVPAGFTSITQPYGMLMEETIRKVAGQVAGDISSSYAAQVYAGGRTGATFLAIPVFNGQQILWQDAAGTVPSGADDPVMRLDDISGLGHHAIQPSGTASFTLRTDGTDWWIDVAESDDRPIFPVGAISGNATTLVIGYDQTVSSRSVLMSNASSSSGFLFVSLDGSSSSTMYSEVTFDAIRTDTGGNMADYSPLPGDRDDNYTLYQTSEIITFQGVEFTATWTEDSTGVYMLGYSAGGWATGGKFYGLAIVDGDGFQQGVPRGDGSLAFTPDVGYRIIDGTEGSSADFNHDAVEEATAAISLFKLVDVESGPFDADFIQLSETGDGSTTLDDDRVVPSISTITDGAVVVHIITNGQATTGHTPPAGINEIVDISDGTGEDGTSLAIGWKDYREAGVQPSQTWEIETENITPYRSYAIALKPLFEPVSLFKSNVTAAVTTSASLSLAYRLSGSAEADSEATGSLSRVTQIDGGTAAVACTVTANLGSKVFVGEGSVEAEATTVGGLVLGIGLAGTAIGEALASGEGIPLKRNLAADVDAEVEASGDLARGSLAKGFVTATSEATGDFIVYRGLMGSASAEGNVTAGYAIKRVFTQARVTGAASATGAFLRYAGFSANPVVSSVAIARLESFKEVFFEADVVMESFATGVETEPLATFSEDVIALGLATIVQDFGGTSGRRTITLNPPDRRLNVGRRSGY